MNNLNPLFVLTEWSEDTWQKAEKKRYGKDADKVTKARHTFEKNEKLIKKAGKNELNKALASTSKKWKEMPLYKGGIEVPLKINHMKTRNSDAFSKVINSAKKNNTLRNGVKKSLGKIITRGRG